MSELPKGWIETTLGEACVRALKVNPKDEPEKEITYLDIGGIDAEALRIGKTKTYTGAEAPSRARQLVEEGDVLFSTVRTYLKKIAQVPAQHDGAVASTGFTVLRGSEALDPKYLFYYVTQNAFIKPLSKIQRGTSYPAVRDSDVFEQSITLAPLPEQRRIVARIEELFSRLDAGVAALRHAKAQLQRYRQSVLAAAVTGQLTQAWREQHPDTEPAEELLERILEERREAWSGRGKYKEPEHLSADGLPHVPESWCYCVAETICTDLFLGLTSKVDYVEDGGVPLIRARDINGGRLSFARARCISKRQHDELTKYRRALKGDVLVSKSGTLGTCAIVDTDDEFSIYESIISMRPLNGLLLPPFLLLMLRSRSVQVRMLKNTVGSTVGHLNLGTYRKLALPIPPILEQHKIVAEVEARTTVIDHLEAELDRQIIRSNRLRQSTLATAFAGNLIPNA